MPHIGFNPALEERFQQNRRLGSDLLTLGWVLLGICAVTGIFVFQDIRGRFASEGKSKLKSKYAFT